MEGANSRDVERAGALVGADHARIRPTLKNDKYNIK